MVDVAPQAVTQTEAAAKSTAMTTMLGALLFVVAARWIRGDIKRAA